MDLKEMRVSLFWLLPIDLMFWILRCCVLEDLIGRLLWIDRMCKEELLFSKYIAKVKQLAKMLTLRKLPAELLVSPVLISKI